MTNQEQTQYYLIPRDMDGDYITIAEEIVRQHGIAEYVQTVRNSATSLTSEEMVALRQLQDLLPDRVHLETKNPFLTLSVTPPDRPTEDLASRCQCQCGSSYSCGGGGGGGR